MSDDNLYAAWVAANAEVSNPNKDGKGNYGKYLTLDALLDTLRPIYARHGLVWWQTVTSREGQIGVTTHLAHRSGERISFGTMYGPVGANVQQMGSVRTYLSRYAYLTSMGIAGGEDDDGTLASVAASSKAKPRPEPPAAPVTVKRETAPDNGLITSPQQAKMRALLQAAGLKDRDDVLAFVSDVIGRDVPSSKELSRTEAAKVIDRLEAMTPQEEQ